MAKRPPALVGELISELNRWYSGKRVFITGHTGFKGTWLTAWLVQAGAKVSGYALEPDEPSLFRQSRLASRINSTFADICDQDSLSKALAETQPEIVFHLAAQSLVRRSYQDPVETYRTNVMGTVQLLNELRRVPSVTSAVIVTSDKCYDNREAHEAYAEDDPLGGSDPYSSSKAGAELATSAFRQSFFSSGVPAVASARAGNVIGGGDWAEDRLIPDIMRAAQKGVPARIRNPQSVRPWQFVLEPLRGYLMLGAALAEHGQEFAGAWNFGPAENDTVAVAELASWIAAARGNVSLHTDAGEAGPAESSLLKIDSTKAAERLKWRPAVPLKRAVDLTVAGYKAFDSAKDALPEINRILMDYWNDVDVA